MRLRYRQIPRVECRVCGFVMLEVETVCIRCEDRNESTYTELRRLAEARRVKR